MKNDWAGYAPPYLCNKRTAKEENRVRMCKRLPIKCVSFSFNFPMFPYCSLLLWSVINSSYFCRQKRAMKRRTDKGITNKITIKLWDILSLRIQIGQGWGTRYSVLPRPATRHSENRAGTPIGCTTVMYASCLTSASVHCSTIGIQVCYLSRKSGISAITGVRMWSDYSKANLRNQKTDKTKINK